MKESICNLNSKVSSIKGIGPQKTAKLKKMEILTIEDLLSHFPRDYEDRRRHKKIAELVDGESALLRCRVDLIVKNNYRYGKKRTLRLLASDDSGTIEVLFFNAAYLESTIIKYGTYCFFGKISINDGRIQIIHPDISKWEDNRSIGIIPLYNLTLGISQNDMRKWTHSALDLLSSYSDYLPQDTLSRNRLCDIEYALTNIHFPKDLQRLKEAKYRLIFEELLVLQTGLLLMRNRLTESGNGIAFSKTISIEPFIQSLPYNLTQAQERVLKDMMKDMEALRVMNRLIQGDVGSGKTVLSAAAIYKAIQSGYQAVMMAPTELLAKQHFETMSEGFKAFDFKIGFLTSSISGMARSKLLKSLENGEIDLLIGTHAVIQPTVCFKKLGLVITDEQHRFGVAQRLLLTKKGSNPDILIMTATPIPRTLAIILYGDLDISILDELPPGRKEIITKVMDKGLRDSAYVYLEEEIKKGRQAYIVAPLIEDSEQLESKSATALYDELKVKFRQMRLALLHGELKQQEKEAIMSRFNAGEIDALISTVVIEVGINVPNATCMLIENAERFGLAQLHQLRGRVGRGVHQSTCFLITDSKTSLARQRTQIMQETNDGFIIAEKDLDLRGPGEFFGTKQHGIPELKIANLIKHIKILSSVKSEAQMILNLDPNLTREENAGFKEHIAKMFEKVSEFTL